MKKIIPILFGLLLSFGAFAQKDVLEKADKYYDEFFYTEAIEKYEIIKKKKIDVLRKLTQSYLKVDDYQSAEKYAKIVVDHNKSNGEDMFVLASILRINRKYDDADKWMAKFAKENPDDLRGKDNAANVGAYNTLLNGEKTFTIKNLDINSPEEDFGTCFWNNNVVFSSSRKTVKSVKRQWSQNKLPYLDLYMATIQSNHDLAEAKIFRKALNKKFHEGPCSFNEAGDYLVFTRNNYENKSSNGKIKLQLFVCELIDGEWSDPVPVPFNSSEYSVGHATLTNDGKTMYFVSDMPGGMGGVDLYKSLKNPNGIWTKPINLGPTINTESNEMFPFIHSDGILFFASDGHLGLGGLDIFKANMNDGEISSIVNLGAPINSNQDDFSFIINENQSFGYFSSNRDGGKGSDDIYSFETNKPFSSGKTIRGIAKNAEGKVVPNAEIILISGDGFGLEMYITKEDGSYEFQVDNDQKYLLIGSNDEYEDADIKASTFDSGKILNTEIVFEKKSK